MADPKLIWPPPLHEGEEYITSPVTGLKFPVKFTEGVDENGEPTLTMEWGKEVRAAAEMTREAFLRLSEEDEDEDEE